MQWESCADSGVAVLASALIAGLHLVSFLHPHSPSSPPPPHHTHTHTHTHRGDRTPCTPSITPYVIRPLHPLNKPPPSPQTHTHTHTHARTYTHAHLLTPTTGSSFCFYTPTVTHVPTHIHTHTRTHTHQQHSRLETAQLRHARSVQSDIHITHNNCHQARAISLVPIQTSRLTVSPIRRHAARVVFAAKTLQRSKAFLSRCFATPTATARWRHFNVLFYLVLFVVCAKYSTGFVLFCCSGVSEMLQSCKVPPPPPPTLSPPILSIT